MPSAVRPPKMTSGTRMNQETLWSKIPTNSSRAVTTAQIVSTMKRGENGSSSVSMTSPRRRPPTFASIGRRHDRPALRTCFIRGRGHRYDRPFGWKLSNLPGANQSGSWGALHIAARKERQKAFESRKMAAITQQRPLSAGEEALREQRQIRSVVDDRASALDKSLLDHEMARRVAAALDEATGFEHGLQLVQHRRAAAHHDAIGGDVERRLAEIVEQLLRGDQVGDAAAVAERFAGHGRIIMP